MDTHPVAGPVLGPKDKKLDKTQTLVWRDWTNRQSPRRGEVFSDRRHPDRGGCEDWPTCRELGDSGPLRQCCGPSKAVISLGWSWSQMGVGSNSSLATY